MPSDVKTLQVENEIAPAGDKFSWRDVAVPVGLLVLFVFVRWAFARHFLLPMADPEEFIPLRLRDQLSTDLPLGLLSDYAYGGTLGFGGSGQLFLSLGYVLLSGLLPWLSDSELVRVMGMLWALAGALLAANIAARLAGRQAALTTFALFSIPLPMALVYGSTAFGNHVESTVLWLAALRLVIEIVNSEGLRSHLLLGLLGALSLGLYWFAPISAPVTGLLLLTALGLALRTGPAAAPTHLFALAAGLVLTALCSLIVPFSGEAGGPGVPVRDALRFTLDHVTHWPRWALSVLASQPLYSPSRLMTLPNHGDLLGLLTPLASLVSWAGFGSLVLWLFRADRRRASDVLGVALLLLITLGVPLGLFACGFGPHIKVAADLGMPHNFFWDPRRTTLIYSVAALGLGTLPHWGTPLARRVGWGLWSTALALHLFGLALLLTEDVDSSPDATPELYLLCPTVAPVDRTMPCLENPNTALDRLGRDILEEFDEATPALRDAGIQALGAWRDCDQIWPYRLPTIFELTPEERTEAWRIFGKAGLARCPDKEVVRAECIQRLVDGPDRSACLEAVLDEAPR